MTDSHRAGSSIYLDALIHAVIVQVPLDWLLIILWQCNKSLQLGIRTNVKNLRCLLRLTVRHHPKFCHPSFLPQLQNLQGLTITVPATHEAMPNLLPIYQNFEQYLPQSLTSLTIDGVDLPCTLSEIGRLMLQRPRLFFHGLQNEWLRSNWEVSDQLLDRVIYTDDPINAILPFVSVLGNARSLDMLAQCYRKPWFREYCQAHVNHLQISHISITEEQKQQLLLFFPNITELSVNLAYANCNIMSSLLHQLTVLKIVLSTQQLDAVIFPPQLLTLNIELCEQNLVPSATVVKLLKSMPVGLLRLTFVGADQNGVSDYLWTAASVLLLPRGLQELHLNIFPWDEDAWAQLPPELISFTTWRSRDICGQHPITLYQFLQSNKLRSINASMYSPGIFYPAGDELLPFSTRFTGLLTLTLNIMDAKIFSQKGPQVLPPTVKELTLYLNYSNPADEDNLRSLVWPPGLQTLSLILRTVPGYFVDMNHWSPLPNSLRYLTLTNIYLRSLPGRWPVELLELRWQPCHPHPNVGSMVRALVDGAGYILACRLNEIFTTTDNPAPSLLAIPRGCLTFVGSGYYLETNRESNSLELVFGPGSRIISGSKDFRVLLE